MPGLGLRGRSQCAWRPDVVRPFKVSFLKFVDGTVVDEKHSLGHLAKLGSCQLHQHSFVERLRPAVA